MASIVFSGPNTVKTFIVTLYQCFAPLRIFENPVFKGLFNGILLLLCEYGLVSVDYSAFIPIFIYSGIINFGLSLIQCIFQ